MMVNITEEISDSVATVQAHFQQAIDELDDFEKGELRAYRAKMGWLKDRIDLLTEIDTQVTDLEAQVETLSAELAIRREELRIATEERMQAQMELKDRKNQRRIALLVYDEQLATLAEEIAIGDLHEIVGRVETAVRRLWHRQDLIPHELRGTLPALGDTFILGHCLDQVFAESTRREPVTIDGFIKIIVEVCQEA